jgi:hypothetical protein
MLLLQLLDVGLALKTARVLSSSEPFRWLQPTPVD